MPRDSVDPTSVRLLSVRDTRIAFTCCLAPRPLSSPLAVALAGTGSLGWLGHPTRTHARPAGGQAQPVLAPLPGAPSSLSGHHISLTARSRPRDAQVGLVLLFWISRILVSPAKGPRVLYLRRLNRLLARFTPWQIILSTLTLLYAVRHGDVLLGLQAPEPLARLYSRDYYRCAHPAQFLSEVAGRVGRGARCKMAVLEMARTDVQDSANVLTRPAWRARRATWFVTALDAGFATAMNIRWKWLRDIASLLFSAYYLFFANEADEKVRRHLLDIQRTLSPDARADA